MTKTIIDQLLSAQCPWLADGGLETSIIFHDGIDLPLFASFHLLESENGLEALARYFERYIALARDAETGFVLDTATWRSGAFWADQLGRSMGDMENATRAATAFAVAIGEKHQSPSTPIVINGVVGPAGDGYAPDTLWTADAAEQVHAPQVNWMADAGADLISAVTFTHTGEAIGLIRAAQKANMPVVVSFTVETDGNLPSGQSMADAIVETDAATDAAPVYYMVNCAHPDHFAAKLTGDWTSRIGGVRANASRLSHAELDMAEELDEGDPEEFGELYGAFARQLPNLRVIGGCCGTDDRHVGCAARHVLAPSHAAK